MALKSAGFVISAFLIYCGQLPSSVRSQTPQQPPAFAFFEYGIPHGDKEVSVTYPQVIDLNFNISFLGFNYSKIYISADGTIGFEKEVNYIENIHFAGGVIYPDTDVPFIAPLLHKGYRPFNMPAADYHGKINYRAVNYVNQDPNVDKESWNTRDVLKSYLPEAIINFPENFDIKFLIVVTWDNIAEGTETGLCSRNSICNSTSFQVVLTGDYSNTFAIFNYGHYNIGVKKNYEAGFNAGRGRGWYNVLPCHGGCDRYLSDPIKHLGTYYGSDKRGRYIFSVGNERVSRGGCLDKLLPSGILEVYPRTVGMFGGEKLQVSGQCGSTNAKVICRFGNAARPGTTVSNGIMVNNMRGYCPVPLLSTTGRIDLYWSSDGTVWSADQGINVVLPSRLGAAVVVNQAVREGWYKRDSKEITVQWDPSKFLKTGTANVNITLIGYREDTVVQYKTLRTINSTQNSAGLYKFNVDHNRCTQDCEQFEIGLLEVSLPDEYHRLAAERVAVRFGPIPLGWYVNQDLQTRRGSDWSDQKCRAWRDADARDTQWLKDLLPCPCSLDQAVADFGRWQADSGCNLFTGSQCQYHQGAIHCVRSIVPTSKDGAGNQCCYNKDRTLMYSQLSYQGSTPDRSHAWGAQPYNTPNKVPELSHWKHDVISFYYCCLWNNYKLCDVYMAQRPTADCTTYVPPAIGSVYGHTHITTFDGLNYNFPAAGDYWLVENEVNSFIIQGKFEPRAQSWDMGVLRKISPWKPSALTSIAMSSGRKKIQVAVTPAALSQRRGLDITVDGEHKYFLDKASFWQDFQEFAVINNAPSVAVNHHDNFTFLLNTFNIGVNVAAINGILHVVVVMPPQYKATGRVADVVALLGTYDGKLSNDATARDGTQIPPQTGIKSFFDTFIHSWKLNKTDYTLFKTESPASDLDPNHSFFVYSDIPNNFPGAPDTNTVNQFCGNSDVCKWDYQITGDRNVASATKKEADFRISYLQNSASLVDNCGRPNVGTGVLVSSERFNVGDKITVTKCTNGKSVGSGVTFSCLKETLSEAKNNGRGDYGTTRTDTTTGQNYIIHWSPKPYTICSDVDKSSNLPMIIGVAVGAVVVVIIIIVVIIVVIRRKKSGKSSANETPAPAERAKRDVERDPAEASAMLTRVEERSPVYKGKTDPVRMSELPDRGSNV